MNSETRTSRILRTSLSTALPVGAAGGLLSAVGYVVDPTQFARSYLLAFVFWLQLPLGCLAIVLLHELVGGSWGRLLQPLASTTAATVPLFVALFIPVWWHIDVLFPWHETAAQSNGHISEEKRLYLNETAFTWRSGGYFLAWSLGSVLVTRWSVRPGGRVGEVDAGRRQRFAAIGLLLFVLTVSFAAIDWLMSLEPAWYSSIYGGLAVMGVVLAAWCFVVGITGLLSPDTGEPSEPAVQQFHDVGNLLLAFLMVWVYFALSQFLIIWSGDLPEETVWYRDRLAGGWQWFVPAIAIGHFVVPFTMLLSRSVKRTPRHLAAVAGGLLLMRLVDLYWSVMPAFSPRRFAVHWLDFAALAAVGGVWLAVLAALLIRRLRHQEHDSISHD